MKFYYKNNAELAMENAGFWGTDPGSVLGVGKVRQRVLFGILTGDSHFEWFFATGQNRRAGNKTNAGKPQF